MAEHFPFVLLFAEAKLVSGFILDYLNKKVLHFAIAPESVVNELSKYSYVAHLHDEKLLWMQTFPKADNERRVLDDQRKMTLFALAWVNNHTLVHHAVGQHNDVFNGNTGVSLENKRAFKICAYHYPNLGRGGVGNQFVFALLDWCSSTAWRRRLLYHSQDNEEVHRVTAQIWANFLSQEDNMREVIALAPDAFAPGTQDDLIPEELQQAAEQIYEQVMG
jgi:hypothetical protein